MEPIGTTLEGKRGDTLLQLLRAEGIPLSSDCGGHAACGRCRVRIPAEDQSSLSPVTETEKLILSPEELQDGIRLACRSRVLGNLRVFLPDEDIEGETQILMESVVLHQNGQISEADPVYGVSIDIGTTTLAAYLYDLASKKQLASASGLNPQIPYGTDVISRIAYCEENPGGEKFFQSLIIKELNQLIKNMAKAAGISQEDISKAVLVGNTVMEHLLLELSPESLGKYPFKPIVKNLVECTPKELPLCIHPEGNILVFPAADGFIGGDHMGVLLSTNPGQYSGNTLVVDIGTNTEITLCTEGMLYSTSCATGPALEGGTIRFGMRAAKGAIDHVTIDPVTLKPELHVIGNCGPKGICGSGIIDVVSQLAETGVLNPDGSFSKRFSSPYMVTDGKGDLSYLLYDGKHSNGTKPEGTVQEEIIYEGTVLNKPLHEGAEHTERILITQEDVRAVQLAKAALYAGIQILVKHSGIISIDRILLAGGFGYYLDKIRVLKLGLFPDCDPETILPVGNAAGAGAILALLEPEKLQEATTICEQIHFTESASDPAFQKFYADAMYIPHRNSGVFLGKSPESGCPGLHNGMLPEKAFSKELTCLGNGQKIAELAEFILREGNMDAFTLPLLQNLEACVYGAPMEKKKGYWAPGAYPYASVEDLAEREYDLLSDTRIQAVLEAIKLLRKTSDRCIILEAAAPFTILTALVDPRKIYAAMRKKPDLVRSLLESLAEAQLPYLEAALSADCTVISLAEPLGTISMVGEKNYKEILAPSILFLLKKMKRHTKKRLIHLCGKMATDLIKSGYGVSYPLRTPDYNSYAEQLLFAADDPKIRFIGPGCVHTKRIQEPILQYFELTNGGK
ncbi:MAG: ASKHA domain-containing protein [Lachnospiraceae bacterium]|nr:ASKHA domain-containing protein [Lachnospiraceae bacterium]